MNGKDICIPGNDGKMCHSQDKFIVPRGGSENDPLNTKITVTNKEKKLGKLKLKKTFNPSENEGVLPYSLRSGLYYGWDVQLLLYLHVIQELYRGVGAFYLPVKKKYGKPMPR